MKIKILKSRNLFRVHKILACVYEKIRPFKTLTALLCSKAFKRQYFENERIKCVLGKIR